MRWDPTQYLRYAGERLRPAIDLLGRIAADAPPAAVDLGCGAGNLTAIMRQRWPQAAITGVDASAEMLARATAAVPDCRFVQADFGSWTPEVAPDVIFSNAALHWRGGHAALMPRLLGLLAPGGVLAVQMPAMHAAPLRALQYEVAANGPWADLLADVESAPPILSPGEYWDILRPLCAELDMWETIYMHALQGENAAVQWAMGTSLKPFLDALPEDLRADYLAAYSAAVAPHYPRRADGVTLLPFRRLFFIATPA